MVVKRSSRRTRITKITRRTKRNKRNKRTKRTKRNRLNKSKKILRLRKKKYSKRKKSNVLKRNVLKRYKKQMGGAATGGEFLNRIGFELETCLTGKKVNTGFGVSDCLAITSLEEKIFDGDLNYFQMTKDRSIECESENCSMELVLKDDYTFTYSKGGLVYANGNNITEQLQSEILLIVSKANRCIDDSCGFHVHMSDTRPNHTLNDKDGKLFLLKALALWCGIEGITDGKQNTTFEHYVRDETGDDYGHADKLGKLNMEAFRDVYLKATNGTLTNLDLLVYLKSVYDKEVSDGSEEAMLGYHGYRAFAFNIYFLGEGDKRAREEWRKRVRDDSSWGEDPSTFLSRYGDPREMYDIMLAEELWNKPLRIEFRGHKDLMEAVMIEVGAETDATRKASVFYEKLKDYLDTINDFFERAKVYEPL